MNANRSTESKLLSQKLGIKEGYIISLINHPQDYGHELFPIPPACSVFDTLTEKSDVIQYFARDETSLKKDFPKLKEYVKPNGSLWISWEKQTNKNVDMSTERKSRLDKDSIRTVGLEYGFMSRDVIDVNELWSAIQFVYPANDLKN